MACFFLKAISSQGIVLLAVDSEVLARSGIGGLTRLICTVPWYEFQHILFL